MNNYGKLKNNKAFTLVEIMISITILSVIMVSVFTIFITSGDINNKTDVNRIMQENIKNLSERLREDVRVNGIAFGTSKHIILTGENYATGTSLYTNSGEYYLAKYDNYTGLWIATDNSSCVDIKENCTLVFNDGFGGIAPVLNSWVRVSDLTFYVSNEYEPKVTVNFVIQPASKKGIKPSLIVDNKLVFQTTFSERLYKDY